MKHIRKMDHRKSGDGLMVICSETGCSELDPESGGPIGSFLYSELIQGTLAIVLLALTIETLLL